LKTELFYRHGRGVALTASGTKLRETASPLLDRLEMIRREIREEAAKESGIVTLGVPPSIGSSLCAPLSRRFANIYPDARLRIREAFSGLLSEWIEAGRLDVAILYDARRRRDLLVTSLLSENLYFIERTGKSRKSPARWQDILATGLVLPGPENGMRRVIERAARDAGVALDIRMEVDSVPAIRQLVASGAGGAILPFGAVHTEVKAGLISARPIEEKGMNAVLVVATPRSRPVTRATRALIKLIQSEVLTCIECGILRGEFSPPLPAPEGNAALHEADAFADQELE
jgi:LysR family nitrogen assimilation transcriptional regulator